VHFRHKNLATLTQGLLVTLAVAHLLVPVQAWAAKKPRVLVLQTQSEGLEDDDKAAATTIIRNTLGKYPKIKLLATPEIDLLELMLELECTDIDVECLTKIGKHYKADRVVYSEAESKGGGLGVKFKVVNAGKPQMISDIGGKANSKSALPKTLGKLITAAFGAAPAPVTAGPKTAPVTIKSNLKGANVWLNGELAGRTPLRIKLKVGKYKVRVHKDGYIEVEESLTVKAGKRVNLAVKLEKTPTSVTPGDPDPDPEEPIAPFPPVKKQPDDDTPFYQTWWFWTSIGVGVAGIVTVGVLATGGEDPAPTGVLNFGFGSPDYDPLVLQEAR